MRLSEIIELKRDRKPNEVELTQHGAPSGRVRTVYAKIGKELADKAVAADLRLSCEILRTNEVAIYGRLPSWNEDDEIVEIAVNGPANPEELTPIQATEKIVKELLRIKGES